MASDLKAPACRVHLIMRYMLPLAALCIVFPAAYASDIDITAGQDIFYYGDDLTYTVTVSEVTGNPAFLYIIDGKGTKSSAIPLDVSQLVTEHRAPFPFESTTYPEGIWMLEIHYGQSQAEADFILADSGQVVIPVWIKDAGRLWINGADAQYYTSGLGFLVEQGIISPDTPPVSDSAQEHIPEWVKVITSWWILDVITDDEYAEAIEYLIDRQVIRIARL